MNENSENSGRSWHQQKVNWFGVSLFCHWDVARSRSESGTNMMDPSWCNDVTDQARSERSSYEMLTIKKEKSDFHPHLEPSKSKIFHSVGGCRNLLWLCHWHSDFLTTLISKNKEEKDQDLDLKLEVQEIQVGIFLSTPGASTNKEKIWIRIQSWAWRISDSVLTH